MSIQPVTGTAASQITQRLASPPTPTAKQGEFTNVLKDFVQNANQQHMQADKAIQNFADGNSNDIQSVALSMAKADLSFRLVLEIRNKLMDAYQEIMRMQV